MFCGMKHAFCCLSYSCAVIVWDDIEKKVKIELQLLVSTKDYYITGRANPISCAVGLR